MPRSKRSARQSGLARSLGASRSDLILCLECRRKLPRESIAYIGRSAVPTGYQDAGKPIAYCGQCWPTVEREAYRLIFKEVIEEELGIKIDEDGGG